MLAAQVSSRAPQFRLVENPYDLLFSESPLYGFLLEETETHHLAQISGGGSPKATAIQKAAIPA